MSTLTRAIDLIPLRRDMAVGLGVSLAVHFAIAFGGEWSRKAHAPKPTETDEKAYAAVQPVPVEPEETEDEELADRPTVAEPQAFAPPTLVDAPQAVSFNDITQTIQPPAPPSVTISNSMLKPPSGAPGGTVSAKKVADLFRIEDLDTIPRLVKQGHLQHPPDLKRARVAGEVTLRVIIDKDGSPIVDGIVKSSHHDFEAAASAFARECQFQVPRRNGIPVRTVYAWSIKFPI